MPRCDPLLLRGQLVVGEDLQPVPRPPPVQEEVGPVEGDEDAEHVEELAEDEAVVVDVVLVVDVVAEKLREQKIDKCLFCKIKLGKITCLH